MAHSVSSANLQKRSTSTHHNLPQLDQFEFLNKRPPKPNRANTPEFGSVNKRCDKEEQKEPLNPNSNLQSKYSKCNSMTKSPSVTSITSLSANDSSSSNEVADRIVSSLLNDQRRKLFIANTNTATRRERTTNQLTSRLRRDLNQSSDIEQQPLYLAVEESNQSNPVTHYNELMSATRRIHEMMNVQIDDEEESTDELNKRLAIDSQLAFSNCQNLLDTLHNHSNPSKLYQELSMYLSQRRQTESSENKRLEMLESLNEEQLKEFEQRKSLIESKVSGRERKLLAMLLAYQQNMINAGIKTEKLDTLTKYIEENFPDVQSNAEPLPGTTNQIDLVEMLKHPIDVPPTIESHFKLELLVQILTAKISEYEEILAKSNNKESDLNVSEKRNRLTTFDEKAKGVIELLKKTQNEGQLSLQFTIYSSKKMHCE